MSTWLPYRPSNGTEGEIFMDAMCNRCLRDAAFRRTGHNGGCSILGRTLLYQIGDPLYPREWVRREGDNEWPGSARCLAFQPAIETLTKRAKKAWATRRANARAAFAGELFAWD